MNKKLAKAEYVISDNYSGTEITVRLEIDYEAKTFRVKSIRKDGIFVFNDKLQSYERLISICNAIRSAAEFAKIELEGEVTPKGTIEAFTQ